MNASSGTMKDCAIRALMIDDNQAFLDAIVAFLQIQDDIWLVRTTRETYQALKQVAELQLYCVQHEKPSFLSTKSAASTPLARVACKIIRRSKNSVFEVDLSIDVILLDISMSSLSGLEVIPYFRATVPDVSMVILTLQDKTFYPPALAAGASAFVSKFELITDLLPAIRQVVQWQ